MRVERHGPRGGGNRHGARGVVRDGYAAKCNSNAKRQICEYAESVTKLILENSSDEHESIVGWAYQPNNETEIDHASAPLGIFASKPVSCRHCYADLH